MSTADEPTMTTKSPGKLSVASAYNPYGGGFDSTSPPVDQLEFHSVGFDGDGSARPTTTITSDNITLERDFKRLQEGFRVKAFIGSLTPEPAILHLDRERMNICISPTNADAEEKKDGGDSDRLVKIPMNHVFKLEFGRAGMAGTRLHPLKSFSIAIEDGPSLFYYDFEADTPVERDYLVSTLIHVLEAIYNYNELRQDNLTVRGNTRGYESERRDLDDILVETQSYSSIDGIHPRSPSTRRDTLQDVLGDDAEEGGTIDQPIPCSPSLEMTTNEFIQPLNPLRKSADTHTSLLSPSSPITPSSEGVNGSSLYGAASHTGVYGRDSFESRDPQDWTSRDQRHHEARSYDILDTNHEGGLDHGNDDRLEQARRNDPIEEKKRALLRSLLTKSPVQRNSFSSAKPLLQFDSEHTPANPEVSPRKQSEGRYRDEPIDLVGGHESSVDLSTPDLAPDANYVGRGFDPSLLVKGEFVNVDHPSAGDESYIHHQNLHTITENGGNGRQPSGLDAKLSQRTSNYDKNDGGWMTYRSTNSFSENSTVAASNVRQSRSRSNTYRTSTGSSPSEPIFVDEGQTDRPDPDGVPFDDGHSQNTDVGEVEGRSLFMSNFRSKTFFDFSGHPSQSYDLRPSNSQHQLVGPWCSDDVCTTTLNDMAQTCSGIFAADQSQYAHVQPTCIDPSLLADDQIQVVQEYVNNALGAPSAMYEYFVEDPSSENPTEANKSDGSSNRVKNRSTVRNAQAGRLRNLRKEMTFASALQNSRDHMQIRTTRSFNDAPPARITNQAANHFLGSALLTSVVNTMVQQGGDFEDIEHEEDDVAYYDSDPEDSRERTLHHGPRRVSAQMKNRLTESNRNEERSPPPGLGKIRNKLSRKVDESLVKEVVQVMQNDRLTLMWHPTQSRDHPNRAPTLVRLWIESGLQLVDGSFLLPKLTWTKVNDGDSTSFKTGELHKLDLLDITRIRATDTIDRERHPFASRRVSFVIESQNEIYLFEAETTQERERVVYGLKVVVARLASLLMLRDYRAAEEFFGAAANMVPGEAPF